VTEPQAPGVRHDVHALHFGVVPGVHLDGSAGAVGAMDPGGEEADIGLHQMEVHEVIALSCIQPARVDVQFLNHLDDFGNSRVDRLYRYDSVFNH
jgi:hypothetical protein